MLFKFIYIIFMCMNIFPACISVLPACLAPVENLELELWRVVSYHVDART